MSSADIAWKPARIGYPAAKRRTPRDVAGTAYWVEKGKKHSLYVKLREDRWLCFRGPRIEACVAQYRAKPGAGAPSSDFLTANGIATMPSQTVRTAKLVAAKPARRPRSLSARLTADEIWLALAERGAPVIRRPVQAKEIAAAETALKFRFPRSYIELVTRHGAPAVDHGSGRGARPIEDLPFAVLTPKEVVRFTRELRKLDADMFEDPASLPRVKAQLANAVFFQIGSDPGEGYVFLVDTADAHGEMKIADYHHDYIEELDWRPSSKAVFRSLSASTLHAGKQIERDLP